MYRCTRVRRNFFFGYLANFCYKLSFVKQKFLLKYPYLYVICSVESRIMDFGLAHLNWPSTQCISFKLAVMVYQCVRGLKPAYLADALQPVARILGRQLLRSSSTSASDVPSTWLSTVGDRALPVTTARTSKKCASWSDVIKFLANLQNQTKIPLFLASFP